MASYYTVMTLAGAKALGSASVAAAASRLYITTVGPFTWDSTSTLTGNDTTVIQVTGVATGRYVRDVAPSSPITFSSQADVAALTTAEMSDLYHCFTTEYSLGVFHGGKEWFFDSSNTDPDGYMVIAGSDDSDGSEGCMVAVTDGRLISPYDFGCQPGSANANSAGLNAWLAFCWPEATSVSTSSQSSHTAYLPPGEWYPDTTGLSVNVGYSSIKLITDGARRCSIVLTNVTDDVGLKIRGLSSVANGSLDGVYLNSGGNDDIILLQVLGVSWTVFDKWYFTGGVEPVELKNDADSVYTEGVQFHDCYFYTSNTSATCGAIRFTKDDDGDPSFRSCGFTGTCTYQSGSATVPAILIDNNCLPYLSPLYLTGWVSDGQILVQNNNVLGTYRPPLFYGEISVEGNNAVLGAGYNFFFNGDFLALGKKLYDGTAFRTRQARLNASNVLFAYDRLPYSSISDEITTAGDAISLNVGAVTSRVSIRIYGGTTYAWQGEVMIVHDPDDLTIKSITPTGGTLPDPYTDTSSAGAPTIAYASSATTTVTLTVTSLPSGSFAVARIEEINPDYMLTSTLTPN